MIQTAHPIPEGLDVFPDARGIIVRHRWFTWTILALALFAVSGTAFWFFGISRPFTPKAKCP